MLLVSFCMTTLYEGRHKLGHFWVPVHAHCPKIQNLVFGIQNLKLNFSHPGLYISTCINNRICTMMYDVKIMDLLP